MPQHPSCPEFSCPLQGAPVAAGQTGSPGLRSVGVPRCLSRSPAALNGYLLLDEALGAGVLPTEARILISLLVSEIHGCRHCTEFYLVAGRAAGVSEEHMSEARVAKAVDAKTQSILCLVERSVIQRSDVSLADLDEAKRAGLNDAEVAEIVANVALAVFANYFARIKLLGTSGSGDEAGKTVAPST